MVSVVALSGSDFRSARCRVSKVAQSRRVKSIGCSRFDLTEFTASSNVVVGLFLHLASKAKPNAVRESPYMTRSPDFATENPNSHITVSMGSTLYPGIVEASISFSYWEQFTAARFSSVPWLSRGQRTT